MTSIKGADSNISSLQNNTRSIVLMKENIANKMRVNTISSLVIQEKIKKINLKILNNSSLESTVIRKYPNPIESSNKCNQDLIENINHQRKLILGSSSNKNKHSNNIKIYENSSYLNSLNEKNCLEDSKTLHV